LFPLLFALLGAFFFLPPCTTIRARDFFFFSPTSIPRQVVPFPVFFFFFFRNRENSIPFFWQKPPPLFSLSPIDSGKTKSAPPFFFFPVVRTKGYLLSSPGRLGRGNYFFFFSPFFFSPGHSSKGPLRFPFLFFSPVSGLQNFFFFP